MAKDYYKILGLKSKNVNEDAIRKAYRKLAVKWHPDKNPDNKDKANEMFNDVSEAYQVLVCPEKKAIYDKYGEVDPHLFEKGKPFFTDPADMYNDFFGPENPFANEFFTKGVGANNVFVNGKQVSGDNNKQNNIHNIPDMSNMGIPANMGIPDLSQFINQNTSQKTTKLKTQPTTNFEYLDYKVNINTMKNLDCTLEELYHGVNKIITISRSCVDRTTGKTSVEDKDVDVKVEAGFKEGVRLTYEKHGNERVGMVTGDLIVMIKELEHPKFKKYGKNDLMTKVDITLKEAQNGFQKEVTMLNGTKKIINVNQIKNTDYLYKIEGGGMPIRNVQQPQLTYGDLYVGVCVSL